MYKKAYFPTMKALRLTCPYGFTVDGQTGNFSTSGHKGRYALDTGGESGATMDWCFVPTNSETLKCVRVVGGNVNARMFVTTEPVLCADGVIGYVCYEMVHGCTTDLNAIGVVQGAVFNPGKKFYREGTAGTTANHLHIQVARGNRTGKWHLCASGYQLDGELPMHRILYLPNDMTVMASSIAYPWVRDNGEQPIGELQMGDSNYFRRKGPGTGYDKITADGAAWVAKAGEKLGVFEIRDGWARVTQTGHWVSLAGGTFEEYETEQVKKLQVATVGPMSAGDAQKIWDLAKDLGVDYSSAEV